MTHYSLPLKWQSAQHFRALQIPEHLRSWLLESGSLTKRVQEASQQQLQMQIVNMSWHKPRFEEMTALAMQKKIAWVRVAALTVKQRAWILARTVIPQATMLGKGRTLQRLGTRPLGEVLYQDLHLSRDTLEIATVPVNHPDYRWACTYLSEAPAQLWARRSVFFFYQKPLLVTEIFLPTIGYV